MLGLIARRLLQLPIILLAIYTVTLTLAWKVPGNPLENDQGRRPPPEVAQAMRAQYNLDSFWGFYTSYLRRVSGVAYLARRAEDAGGPAGERGDPFVRARVFDFGPSLQYDDWRVNEIIAG
ncbi:MAG TPA: hypothetical protein VD963_11365, partial [Phycisphaerales bacterium]|nr:hypothetical protein [Phycisphaerales bacterium]